MGIEATAFAQFHFALLCFTAYTGPEFSGRLDRPMCAQCCGVSADVREGDFCFNVHLLRPAIQHFNSMLLRKYFVDDDI